MFGKVSEAYERGYTSYVTGLDFENPYPIGTNEWVDWQLGWDAAYDIDIAEDSYEYLYDERMP